MAIVEVIKFEGSPDAFAWKYPNEEISTWSLVGSSDLVGAHNPCRGPRKGKGLDSTDSRILPAELEIQSIYWESQFWSPTLGRQIP